VKNTVPSPTGCSYLADAASRPAEEYWPQRNNTAVHPSAAGAARGRWWPELLANVGSNKPHGGDKWTNLPFRHDALAGGLDVRG